MKLKNKDVEMISEAYDRIVEGIQPSDDPAGYAAVKRQSDQARADQKSGWGSSYSGRRGQSNRTTDREDEDPALDREDRQNQANKDSKQPGVSFWCNKGTFTFFRDKKTGETRVIASGKLNTPQESKFGGKQIISVDPETGYLVYKRA